MKKLIRSLLISTALIPNLASAGSIAVTPGSGTTVGAGTDGTAQIPAHIICGASASATLYATCVNQAIVNASGQFLTLTTVTGTVPLPTGAATAANQEVTAAGTTATNAQGVQGVTGGVPMPVTGTFSSTTPSFQASASGAYLNIPSITNVSSVQNFALPTGSNVVLWNYGGYKVAYQLSTSGASGVVVATADGYVQPGCTVAVAVGSNTNISVGTTAAGLTSSMQIVGGSGLWTGASCANMSLGQTGLTAPSFATMFGTLDNSNLAQAVGSTAAGTSSTKNAMAIQGITGGVSQNIDTPTSGNNLYAAVTAPVPDPNTAAHWGLLAQNTTTASQLAQLMEGAVTASAPSYSASQSSPLSLTTGGDLRTVVDNTLTALVNNADGVAPVTSVTSTAGNSPVNSSNYLFNGTNYDRQRGSATATGVALTNTPGPYPDGAVPITASQVGTTAATTATLTNVTGHLTYICGYSIRANATAVATVTDTITGVKTATLSSILWVAPAASGIGVDDGVFIPCIPASAISTSIAVVSGAPGAGGNVSVRAWGYSL